MRLSPRILSLALVASMSAPLALASPPSRHKNRPPAPLPPTLCANPFGSLRIARLTDPRLPSVELSAGLRMLLDARTGEASIRPSNEHEIDEIRDYARLVFERDGETVLLISTYLGRDVRAFDGVVFDRDGQPVANLSLKATTSAQSHNSAQKAIPQIARYSRDPDPFKEYESVASHPITGNRNSRERAQEQRESLRRWLANLRDFFGVSELSPRPARIVVQLHAGARIPQRRHRKELQTRMLQTGSIVQQIVFITEDGSAAAVVGAKRTTWLAGSEPLETQPAEETDVDPGDASASGASAGADDRGG